MKRHWQETLNFFAPQPPEEQSMSNEMPKSHAPSFHLARMFRRASKEGKTYFTGRLGGARIVLLKSKETADDGGEIWSLLVSEAPKREDTAPRQEQPQQNAYAATSAKRAPEHMRQSDRDGPDLDPQIPF